jgi:hypothetical protein
MTPINKEPLDIDLRSLLDFLNSGFTELLGLDSHDMQIIEEVVFLCLNPDFILDVNILRGEIIKKFPNLNIPASNYDQARSIVVSLGFNHYEFYRSKIYEIISRYNLIPALYWNDRFKFYRFDVPDFMSEDGMTREQAELEAQRKLDHTYQMQILDFIFILNTVFDESEGTPSWINSNYTRKAILDNQLSLDVEHSYHETTLNVSFPPYANLTEMQQLLAKNYKRIQEYRSKHLPLSPKKDRRKTALPKMLDAYLMNRAGYGVMGISLALDSKYGTESTFEGVTKLIERMHQEVTRFDLDK